MLLFCPRLGDSSDRALSGPCPLIWTCPVWPWRRGVHARRQEVNRVAQYRALTGLDYPPNRRAEAGDVVDDLPGKSVKWLLESGLIEPASGAKPASGPKSTPAKPKDPVEPLNEEDED